MAESFEKVIIALFNVFLTNKAAKQFQLLEVAMNLRIQELFKALEETPVPFKNYDVCKLKGSNDCYRIRRSSHRLVYDVDWRTQTVLVVKIERRSETTYK